YDQLKVHGTVTLNNAVLTGTSAALPVGSAITLIDNDNNPTADPVVGTFNPASAITIGGRNYSISYTGNDGNDVVLTRVPTEFVWDGGGANNNWTTAQNWTADLTPALGDYLTFNDTGVTVRPNPVNDFTAGSNFGLIKFDTTLGSYNVTGNAIVLSSAGQGI